MKATSEPSSNLGLSITIGAVRIRVWDRGYQNRPCRRSQSKPNGITFRTAIACRRFLYSAVFTTNTNWRRLQHEGSRISYLRRTAFDDPLPRKRERGIIL